MNFHRLLVLAIVALLALPSAAAFAQGTSTDGYDTDSGQVQDAVTETTEEATPTVAAESAAPSTPAPAPAATLPFTGDDEIIIALAGALLIGTGLAARRFASSTN